MLKGIGAILLQVRSDADGATAVEYAIMVALIAVVIIVAVVVVGENLADSFECAASAVGALPGLDPCAQ